ncbi:response regulator [Rhodopirellula sp.]|jgi:CheY-like chemotaxis protein|nr:response regulator [Rhodopirellula sp.]
MPEPNHILVVDDSPTQVRQIQMVLEGDGLMVRTACDGHEAMECIQADQPLLVVTDLQMPKMNGLELVAAVKSFAASLPVILTTSQGSESIAAQALQEGASSYVPKRDLSTALIPVVRQVLAVNQATQSVQEVAQFATESSISLSLENDELLVPKVISRLELPMVELNLFDEGERMQIAMALDEALLNAMVHGNLEVSSELRQLDDGKPYTDLIAERKTLYPYKERRVTVQMHASLDTATIVIRDEGPGFDLSSLRDPTDPENLEKAGGRGLLLINAFMDEVRHNEKGNEITMVKKKVDPEASTSED